MQKIATILCLSAGLFLASALADRSRAAWSDDSERMPATWYGPGYVGKHTASGERFDPKALTAAHPSLPLGSLVRVRTDTGRSVLVRINDRIRARVIDLSLAAARILHLTGKGRAMVTVEPVEIATAR